MTESFIQLESRSAGGSFFALLCARQFRFAGQALSCSRRLRATLSQARRFAVGVRLAGEALAYVPAFAARRGFGRFLRATNLPERVGALPSVLRATRVLGRRFAVRLQTRRGRRWCVESFAATRGDLSRFLRVNEGSLANVAGGSTKGSARRFGNGRLSCGTPGSPITPRRRTKAKKTANNGAAENCSARHGSCYSYSGVSRSVVALSHVRCLFLRSTFAATAPRSAVAELGVVSRF